MIERISTGQDSLDAVLGGGLPEGSIVLVAGAPGTGKTMLAGQVVFRNGTLDRPALYLATTNEPLDKIVRFGQELEFFEADAVGKRVIYESIGDELSSGGLPAAMDRIVTMLASVRPGILVIDSFLVLRTYAASELEHRRFLAELAQRLTALSTTSLWVGEFSDDLMTSPEAAIADVIVILRSTAVQERVRRSLEVLKLRGGGFLSGEHTYRLGPAGIQVFPRLADPLDPGRPHEREARISLGSDTLDAMTDGGVWPGTSTLIIGPSGAGKTILALDFLTRGARDGRVGVFATLQESRIQLGRLLWNDRRRSFEDRIMFHHRSPVDIYIDEWVHELLESVEHHGATLLAIDSLSDLRHAAPDQKRFEEYVYSLTQRLARRGVTTVMTLESSPVFSLEALSGTQLSNLADNVLLLAYRLDGATVGRVVHLLKTRASDHDPSIRAATITDEGLVIGEPVAGNTRLAIT